MSTSKRGQDLLLVLGSLQKIARSAANLQSKQLDTALKHSSVFNDAVPKAPNPAATSKATGSSHTAPSIDPIELVQKSVFLTENAVIFANAASNKAWKVAKKTVGLSTTRRFQTNYKLKPLGAAVAGTHGSASPVQDELAVEESTYLVDGDEHFYEDEEEEEVVEYKYMLNPRKSAMDLINTVDDFTDRTTLFSSAFMVVPVSKRRPAYKSDFVPRKFGVIRDHPEFEDVFRRQQACFFVHLKFTPQHP